MLKCIQDLRLILNMGIYFIGFLTFVCVDCKPFHKTIFYISSFDGEHKNPIRYAYTCDPYYMGTLQITLLYKLNACLCVSLPIAFMFWELGISLCLTVIEMLIIILYCTSNANVIKLQLRPEFCLRKLSRGNTWTQSINTFVWINIVRVNNFAMQHLVIRILKDLNVGIEKKGYLIVFPFCMHSG